MGSYVYKGTELNNGTTPSQKTIIGMSRKTDENVPNIHYHASHISENFRLTSKTSKDKINSITKRYYNKMFNQIKNQQGNKEVRNFLNSLTSKQQRELVNGIELQMTQESNKILESFLKKSEIDGENIQVRLNEAVEELKNILLKESSEGKKDEAFLAVDNLINIVNLNKQPFEVSKMVVQGQHIVVPQNILINVLSLVKNIENFLELEKNIAKGKVKKKDGTIRTSIEATDLNFLNSLLTLPTEVFGAVGTLIGKNALNLAKKTTEDILIKAKDNLRGTITNKGSVIVGKTNLPVQAKAVDASLGGKNFNYKYLVQVKNDGGTVIKKEINLDLDAFFSNKYYKNEKDSVKVVSVSGKNSFLIPALHEFYGNNDKSNYMIYNALAFDVKRVEGKGAVNDNFRIIRQDLITQYAEKFISGFETSKSQSIIIHNMKAYPVGLVLCRLVQNFQDKLKAGKMLGSGNDLFTIHFSKGDLTSEKRWIKGNGASLANSVKRINNIIKAVNAMQYYGSINSQAFQDLDKYLESKDGIKIL